LPPFYYLEIANTTDRINAQRDSGSKVPIVLRIISEEGNVDVVTMLEEYNTLKKEFSQLVDGEYINYFKLGQMAYNIGYFISKTSSTLHKEQCRPLFDELFEMVKNPPEYENDDDYDDYDDEGYFTADDGIGHKINIGHCFDFIGAPAVHGEITSFPRYVWTECFKSCSKNWKVLNEQVFREGDQIKNAVEKELSSLKYVANIAIPGRTFPSEIKELIVHYKDPDLQGVQYESFKREDDDTAFNPVSEAYKFIGLRSSRSFTDVEFEVITYNNRGKIKNEAGLQLFIRRYWPKTLLLTVVGLVQVIFLFWIEKTTMRFTQLSGDFLKAGVVLVMFALQMFALPPTVRRTARIAAPMYSNRTQEGVKSALLVGATMSTALIFFRWGVQRGSGSATLTKLNLFMQAWQTVSTGSMVAYGGSLVVRFDKLVSVMVGEIGRDDAFLSDINLFRGIRNRCTDKVWQQVVASAITLAGVEALWVIMYWQIKDGSPNADLLQFSNSFSRTHDIINDSGSIHPYTHAIYRMMDSIFLNKSVFAAAKHGEDKPETVEDAIEDIANSVINELQEGVSLDAIKMYVDAEVSSAVRRLNIQDKSPEEFDKIRKALRKKVTDMNATISM